MERGTANPVVIRNNACSGFGCLSPASQIGVVLSAVLATLVGAFAYWYAFIRPRLQKSHESDEQHDVEDFGPIEHHYPHRGASERVSAIPVDSTERGKPNDSSPPGQRPSSPPSPPNEPLCIGLDPLPPLVVTQNKQSFLPPPPPPAVFTACPASMTMPFLPHGPCAHPLVPAGPFHQTIRPQPSCEHGRRPYRLSLPPPGQAATFLPVAGTPAQAATTSPVISARHRSSSSLDQVSCSHLRDMVDPSGKRHRAIDEDDQYAPQPPAPISCHEDMPSIMSVYNNAAESRIGRRRQEPPSRGRRRMEGVERNASGSAGVRIGSIFYRTGREISESRIGRRPREAPNRDQHRKRRAYRDNANNSQSHIGPRPQEQRPSCGSDNIINRRAVSESRIHQRDPSVYLPSTDVSPDSEPESSWMVGIYSPSEGSRSSNRSPAIARCASESLPHRRSSSSHSSRGAPYENAGGASPSRRSSQHVPPAGMWSLGTEAEASIQSSEGGRRYHRPTFLQPTPPSPSPSPPSPRGQDPVPSLISSTGAVCSHGGSVGSNTEPGAGGH